MPLLALWASNRDAVGEFSIEQVVATAGDGSLRDGSVCSTELREYLAQVPTSKIAFYVEQCLGSGFNKSGMVLQDLVNELGRRLDYQVRYGRYQGTVNTIGYDGLWIAPEGHSIIAEVKTTDAYRMSLDTIAGYRDRLAATGELGGSSSILILVGRQDTGELEAQIRGSRHAWDVRLISAESLLKLVQLKENADGPETGQKIRSLLCPMEYTRLDRMVDVMFTAVADVETATIEQLGSMDEDPGNSAQDRGSKDSGRFTDSQLLQIKREKIIAAVSRNKGFLILRRSRALYWSEEHHFRAACAISKRYLRRSSYPYWYAYHPQWDSFLSETEQSLFILGCMDLDVAFAIPRSEICSRLDDLNTTKREDGAHYWHIHIVEKEAGRFALALPKRGDVLPLDTFKFPI